jgi:DnaJ homolog subfamily C member 28
MDFKDWRNAPDKGPTEAESTAKRKYYGRRFEDYIGEQIREAQARGEFDNLPGTGKPLSLEENLFAGDKSMGYNLLKSNGYAPKEIELAKEIRNEFEHIEAKVAKVCRQGRSLRSRRVSPFASEKRAFNAAVVGTAAEYEKVLHGLNRKVLTLNLMAPALMHQPMFDVAKLLQEYREACPLFE